MRLSLVDSGACGRQSVDQVLGQSTRACDVDSVSAFVVHDRWIRAGLDQQMKCLQPFEASRIEDRRFAMGAKIELWPVLRSSRQTTSWSRQTTAHSE